jgi:hypothetical protein
VWWGVPLVISALGGTRYVNGGEENPAAIEPDGTDPAYAAAFDALRRLGYEPVGPGWMRLTFYIHWWTHRTKVRAFRKRAAGRFAFLHESPQLPGWHQVYFATCWADGGLDLTHGGLGAVRRSDDGFEAVGFPTDDPAVLESKHAHRIALREADGRRRDPDLSLTTLLDATERHAGASTVDATATAARAELLALGVFLALGVGPPALLFGFWHALPPAAGLLVLGGYAWLVRRRLVRFTAHVRARAAEEHDSGW